MLDLETGKCDCNIQYGFSPIKMENESQPRHVQKVYHEALTQMSVLWAIMGLGGKSMRNPWFYHQKHVLCFFSINCLANYCKLNQYILRIYDRICMYCVYSQFTYPCHPHNSLTLETSGGGGFEAASTFLSALPFGAMPWSVPRSEGCGN